MEQIVPEEIAVSPAFRQANSRVIPLDANHNDMVKFCVRGDPGYQLVLQQLERIIDKSKEKILESPLQSQSNVSCKYILTEL
jgi:hypothetical protein